MLSSSSGTKLALRPGPDIGEPPYNADEEREITSYNRKLDAFLAYLERTYIGSRAGDLTGPQATVWKCGTSIFLSRTVSL